MEDGLVVRVDEFSAVLADLSLEVVVTARDERAIRMHSAADSGRRCLVDSGCDASVGQRQGGIQAGDSTPHDRDAGRAAREGGDRSSQRGGAKGCAGRFQERAPGPGSLPAFFRHLLHRLAGQLRQMGIASQLLQLAHQRRTCQRSPPAVRRMVKPVTVAG